MSNSTCHFNPAKNRTESDMPTGGICDVPGYPCKRCRHEQKCTNMYCESFQRFYRNFMNDFRAKLGVSQPKSLLSIFEEEQK